jgi:hypothetical protein
MTDLAGHLLTLPSLTIYAVFMTATAVVAGLCCVLLARIARPPTTKEHLDVAMRTTGAVMAALTLILAFCAVQARGIAADARATVSAEVAAIGVLARLADRMGGAGHALKHDIAGYLRSIAQEEFPAMANQGRHSATDRWAEAVEGAAHAAAGTIPETLAADLLEEADDVEATREKRLRAAHAGLPREFWLLIALLFGLLAATGALYPPRIHTVAMLAIQAAGCGALIAFVFIVDQPFRGSVRITAEPYATLLHAIEHRSAVARGGPRLAAP